MVLLFVFYASGVMNPEGPLMRICWYVWNHCNFYISGKVVVFYLTIIFS